MYYFIIGLATAPSIVGQPPIKAHAAEPSAASIADIFKNQQVDGG